MRHRAKVGRILAGVAASPATHAGMRGVRLDHVQKVPDGRGGTLAMPATLFLAAAPDGRAVGVSAIALPGRSLDAALDAAAARPPLPGTTAAVMDAFVSGTQMQRPFGTMGDPPRDLAAALVAETKARVDAAVASSGLAPHLREALDILRAWPRTPSQALTAILADPGADGRAARGYCREAPFLAACQWERDIADVAAVFGPSREPALAPALRRRLASLDPRLLDPDPGSVSFSAFLSLAAGAPVDWFPAEGDGTGIRAMHDAARLCRPLSRLGLPEGRLVRSARGDWSAFVGRCLAATGRHVLGDGSVPDVGDAALGLDSTLPDLPEAFARAVLLPLRARTGLDGPPSEAIDALVPIAARILYGEKSLPACIEASGRWHAHLHELESEMPSDWDERTWPVPHPTVADGDLRIVPLACGRDMMEEGSPRPDANGVPGLTHCVGGTGYRAAAAASRAHFVSVRRALPDGGYVRLATGEARFEGGRLALRQLLGHRNGPPGDEVEAAMARWLERPVVPIPAAAEEPGTDSLREAVGYDPFREGRIERALAAWAPHLPRDWRGLDPDAFAAAAGFDGPDPRPRP